MDGQMDISKPYRWETLKENVNLKLISFVFGIFRPCHNSVLIGAKELSFGEIPLKPFSILYQNKAQI